MAEGLGTLREVSDQWTLPELLEAHDFLDAKAEAEQMAHHYASQKAERGR